MPAKGAQEIQAETERTAVKALKERAESPSWKDEFVTVIVMFPFALAFLPWTSGWAREGFSILGTVPWEFWGLAAIVVCYAYHRKVVSLFGLVRGVGK